MTKNVGKVDCQIYAATTQTIVQYDNIFRVKMGKLKKTKLSSAIVSPLVLSLKNYHSEDIFIKTKMELATIDLY